MKLYAATCDATFQPAIFGGKCCQDLEVAIHHLPHIHHHDVILAQDTKTKT